MAGTRGPEGVASTLSFTFRGAENATWVTLIVDPINTTELSSHVLFVGFLVNNLPLVSEACQTIQLNVEFWIYLEVLKCPLQTCEHFEKSMHVSMNALHKDCFL